LVLSFQMQKWRVKFQGFSSHPHFLKQCMSMHFILIARANACKCFFSTSHKIIIFLKDWFFFNINCIMYTNVISYK
jgi:hypothetical protein